jgi:hypothetical protein
MSVHRIKNAARGPASDIHPRLPLRRVLVARLMISGTTSAVMMEIKAATAPG